MAIQQEDLCSNYDEQATEDFFFQNAQAKSQNVENIKKKDYKIGVENQKMRSLCIASIYISLLLWKMHQELKLEEVRNFKDEFVFRNIIQLCDTTGWFEGNIGAKYLRLMRQIIKIHYHETNEEFKNLQLYEIISVVIRKMPLKNEDKILIYELAATCRLICDQCSLFRWSSMEVKQVGHSRICRTPLEKIIDIAILFSDLGISYRKF
ncbi:UNKNOWN [Stylonychia lemnae]|uniref:Uncharacterized protein n=1 Tax=Stylonychia lemnae TaxID=5949 RepID=A0A078B883_STYLE|nr:UNKNOWN [Stylonychia lemnae]|eukprot:CDW89778.1 UNKNOWN [Stylonychia lemnae]